MAPESAHRALASPESPVEASVEERFGRRLAEYEALAVEVWQRAGTSPTELGPRHSPWSRWRCGRHLSRQVATRIEGKTPGTTLGKTPTPGGVVANPSDGEVHEAMRRELPALGRELVSLLGLGPAAAKLLTRADMTAATEDFVRQARAEDPDLAAEDLGQALRNVWVIHFFQLLGLGTARHSQASLGYSLLYPYTDNVLDDPRRTPEQKRVRSQRLGLRLSGVSLPPLDDDEARVFQQLDRIDQEFPRRTTPELHLALQAIHRSQVASLRQQHAEPQSEEELLRLSVAKGGSSVLVDAYLVDGHPNAEMTRFAFIYGVALQLADDLQDVESDLAAGHQTLFTRAAQRGTLEADFWRLVGFLDASLGLCPPPSPSQCAAPDENDAGAEEGSDLKRLARASMVHLMIQAVGAQPRVMPASFRRRLGPYSPVTFRRARSLRRRLAHALDVSF